MEYNEGQNPTWEGVKILESTYELMHGRKGRLAVFMYSGDGDPIDKLDAARMEYVQNNGYHEFIDINMDNPWVRVIMSDINEMNQENFDPLKHKMKP